ncbi:MAG TPA: YbhB/YbcL family Raf kinase inhibitor-like protein [Polyangiaceae bacterium]|jgi:hypothetical protein|nr:YbhB/YbcL family Raf kinase inhibitor-like protein [Polyangiaceae bacterium]
MHTRRSLPSVMGFVAWTALSGALLVVLPLATACDTHAASPSSASISEPKDIPASSLALTSPAYAAGSSMPAKYTCEAGDTSPPLAWSGVPAGTKSLALVIDDPDAPDPAAPTKVWVHWVVADIPPSVTGFAEGAASSGLPAGAVAGTNDFGKATYGGPCPPTGRHRYFHELYALDAVLGLSSPTKAALESAMNGHVLGKAELIATYQKTK